MMQSPYLSGAAVTESLIIPVDTGNKQIKTPRHIFTAGLTCHCAAGANKDPLKVCQPQRPPAPLAKLPQVGAAFADDGPFGPMGKAETRFHQTSEGGDPMIQSPYLSGTAVTDGHRFLQQRIASPEDGINIVFVQKEVEGGIDPLNGQVVGCLSAAAPSCSGR